jgi:hypothetical protein
MYPIPIPRLDAFYPAYRAAGGVVDFQVYRAADCSSKIEEERHREVAVAAIKVLTDAMNLHWDFCEAHGLAQIPNRWRCQPEQAKALRISWADFLEDNMPDSASSGYKPLFYDPPYGLRLPKPEIDKLYELSLGYLVPSLSHPLLIHSWSVDWADYFGPGLEWWGAALWTITTDYGSTITAIAASATD